MRSDPKIMALRGSDRVMSCIMKLFNLPDFSIGRNRRDVAAEEKLILLLEHAAPVFRIYKRTVCLHTVAMYTPSSVTLLPTADVLDEVEPGEHSTRRVSLAKCL